MDDSIAQNDENKAQAGKKRQQIESPFSAATPKSRLGKEPKRLFGQSKANLADGNLEETCIEADSRTPSPTPSDATYNESNISNFDNEADPNLEQTELYAAGTSANSTKDLSIVEESEETDADITLAMHLESSVVLEEDRSTPTAPRVPMSPILADNGTPTAPTAILSKIEKSIETIHTHSTDSLHSSMYQAKSHIDFSLHEFEILEQKVEHEEDIKELHAKIDEMRVKHQQELNQINEARTFEEQILIKQMDASNKKAKSDRDAAKAREQSLEMLIEELKMKIQEPNEEKKQLECHLAELNCRIEELTEKALRVDSMQQSTSTYEARIQQLESEHEEVRKMMMLEIERLESEVSVLQSQQASQELDELRDQVISLEKEATIATEKLAALQASILSTEEQAATDRAEAEQKLTAMSEEVAKLKEEAINNVQVIKLEQELVELRNLMVSEVDSLEKELDAARAAPTPDDETKKLLTEYETKIHELTSSLEAAQQNFEGIRKKLEMKDLEVEELSSSMTSLLQDKDVVEKMRIELQSSELRVQELTVTLEDYQVQLDLAKQYDDERNTMKLALESEVSKSDKLTSLVEQLSTQLNSLRQESVSAENNASVLQKDLDDAHQELHYSSEAADERIKQLETALEATSTIQKQLEVSEARIQELEISLAELDVARQELSYRNAQTEEYREKLLLLEASIEEKTDALKNFQTEVDAARETVQTSQMKIKELEGSLEATHTLREELEAADIKIKQFEAIRVELEAIREESVLNNEIKDQIQSELYLAEAKVEELSSTLSSLRTEVEANREELASSHIRIKDLQVASDALKESSELNDTLRSELESSKARVEDLQTQLELIREVAESNDDIKVKLETSEKTILKLNSSVDALTLELETARQQKEESDNIIKELTIALETARSDLELAVQQKEEEIQSKMLLESKIQSLEASFVSLQESANSQKEQFNIERDASRQKAEQLDLSMEELQKAHESKIAELTAHLTAMEQNNLLVDALNAQVSELTMQLENARTEFVGAEQIYQAKMCELREQVEGAQKKMVDQNSRIEEAEAKVQKRDTELISQAQKHAEQSEMLQQVIDSMKSSQKAEDDSRSDELNVRLEELQATVDFAQRALADAEQAKKQKDGQLEQVHQQFESLKQSVEEEKSSLQQAVTEYSEKLEAAEQALSQKENSIAILESRIETISHQFEERLTEMNEWKSQAMNMGTLTETLAQMQSNMSEMTEKLEASNRRVIEVEEMAQHDITLIQDEKREQSSALEEAKSRIAQLEEKLTKAENEVARLEKVCDEFDDDERELKEQISRLQAEIKVLKGVKSPPKAMGLLQQARLGVKPLSRESSHVEPPSNEDGFEDAQDSFQAHPSNQNSLNQSAREASRVQAGGNTMLHPDDQVAEKSAIETPSKKGNRSNCQQQ